MGLRFAQEGIRDIGTGFRSLGEGIQGIQDRQDRLAERDRLLEAERIKKERMAEFGAKTEEVFQRVKDNPEITRAELAPEFQEFAQGSIELGQDILSPVQRGLEGIFKDRESALDRESRVKAATAKAQATGTEKKRKGRKDLRQEFEKGSVTTRTTDLRGTFKNLKSSLSKETPAAGVAAITQFAKFLDPGARVTDADFRNVESARSALERLDNAEKEGVVVPTILKQFLQKFSTDPDKGGVLTPKQRGDMLSVAEDAYVSQLEEQTQEDRFFSRQAELEGFRPQNIIRRPAKEELTQLKKEREDRIAEANKPKALPKADANQIIEIIGTGNNREKIFQTVEGMEQKLIAAGGQPFTAAHRLRILDKILEDHFQVTRPPDVTLEQLGLHGGLDVGP